MKRARKRSFYPKGYKKIVVLDFINFYKLDLETLL